MNLPQERRKDTKRRKKMRDVFYALTGIEGVLDKTPVVYRQAGSLTLTIRAHALRSRRALRYTLLPTYAFCAFPLLGGGLGWGLIVSLSKYLFSLNLSSNVTQYVLCYIDLKIKKEIIYTTNCSHIMSRFHVVIYSL